MLVRSRPVTNYYGSQCPFLANIPEAFVQKLGETMSAIRKRKFMVCFFFSKWPPQSSTYLAAQTKQNFQTVFGAEGGDFVELK